MSDISALQIVAAPRRQHRGGLLVRHPFGHTLELQSARQFDHGPHECPVIGRSLQILHEGAVDLDHVDTELAQIAERREARAEIVNGDAGTEILHPRNKAACIVDVMDGHRLGDLDNQPFRQRWCADAAALPAAPTNRDRMSKTRRHSRSHAMTDVATISATTSSSTR